MSVYDTQKNQYQAGVMASFISRAALNLGSAMLSLRDTVADWNDARITRKALSKLSDRMLDDIGLCRGDIDVVLRNR